MTVIVIVMMLKLDESDGGDDSGADDKSIVMGWWRGNDSEGDADSDGDSDDDSDGESDSDDDSDGVAVKFMSFGLNLFAAACVCRKDGGWRAKLHIESIESVVHHSSYRQLDWIGIHWFQRRINQIQDNICRQS